MIEFNFDDLELEEVQEVLACYAIQLYKLERENADLREQKMKRCHWVDSAKIQAGYSTNTSFDTVWQEVLEKANKYDQLLK